MLPLLREIVKKHCGKPIDRHQTNARENIELELRMRTCKDKDGQSHKNTNFIANHITKNKALTPKHATVNQKCLENKNTKPLITIQLHLNPIK